MFIQFPEVLGPDKNLSLDMDVKTSVEECKCDSNEIISAKKWRSVFVIRGR